MQSQRASRTSFFDLPRELRDSVYDNVLSGVKCKIPFSDRKIRNGLGTNFTLFYERFDDKGDLGQLPHGLLACKQMLDEAFDILCNHAHCTLGTSCNCQGCIEDDGPCRKHSWNRISLDQVKNFNGPIQDGTWDAEGVYQLRESSKYAFWVPYDEHLRQQKNSVTDGFFRYLQARPDHPAKHVKFSISLPSPNRQNKWSTDPVDLSCFRSLGSHFDHVTFRLVCPFGDPARGNQVSLRDTALTFAKLHFEAARTAISMVGGGDDSGYDLEDYCKLDAASTLFDVQIEAKRNRWSNKSIVINHSVLQFVRKEDDRPFSYLPFTYFWRHQLRNEAERGDIRWHKVTVERRQERYKPFPWTSSAHNWAQPVKAPASWHIQDIPGLRDTSTALYDFYKQELWVPPRIVGDS